MLPERDAVFIAQMIEAAQAALDFTEGLGKETVLDTRVVSFAMVRAVQLVGQAARNVSDDVRAVNPDIPWHQIIGMRNVVVHDYADVDLALVWKTVRQDLPPLIARLRAVLDEAEST